MNTESHNLLDGKIHLYKRENSRFWQCSTYIDGRNHRTSTKEESLTIAKDFAREWYMTAYVDSKRRSHNSRASGLLAKFGQVESSPHAASPAAPKTPPKNHGPTFREAAEKFIAEYGIITHGQRNKD